MGLNPYGSNAGLVDPYTAVILWTPSSSRGEQSGDRLDDPAPFVELEAMPAANELIASNETSDNAPQLGSKVVTSPEACKLVKGSWRFQTLLRRIGVRETQLRR